MSTCMDSCSNFSYMFLNLAGEVGEFASKIAKAVRKSELTINSAHLTPVHVGTCWSAEQEADLRAEAGDILWQLSGLCAVMGWSLEGIAKDNLSKLASRQARNVIDGSGDNR